MSLHGAQRQQAKWAFLGPIAGTLGFTALLLPFVFGNIPNGSLFAALSTTGFPLILSVIPVASW